MHKSTLLWVLLISTLQLSAQIPSFTLISTNEEAYPNNTGKMRPIIRYLKMSCCIPLGDQSYLVVYHGTGRVVERQILAASQASVVVGANWPKGIYFISLHESSGQRLAYATVVKQ